jgi:hypothetical protein
MTYDPPAGINDYARSQSKEAELREAWHQFISRRIRRRAQNARGFYSEETNPTPTPLPPPKRIPWNGFPLSIWEWFGAETNDAMKPRAYAAADTLVTFDTIFDPAGRPVELRMRQQDEYCEWHADTDGNGGITRISFSCEGPEYWEIMWDIDPDLVLRLYREHVSPDVQPEDLSWPADMRDQAGNVITFQSNGQTFAAYPNGGYNRWNKWNTTHGIMHLTHTANTLGAEINLAADAAVIRSLVADAPATTHAARLICCAGYGGVNRSSDPLIGKGVNDVVKAGLCVTLENPVGLYIEEVAVGALRSPTNQPIGPSCLSKPRASADGTKILRAEIKPPAGAAYTLDQCKFEGKELLFGGQLARRITMVLFGRGQSIAGRTAETSNSCHAKCCTKSQSNFKAGVLPNDDCAEVVWDDHAPLEPRTGPASAGDKGALTILTTEQRLAIQEGQRSSL